MYDKMTSQDWINSRSRQGEYHMKSEMSLRDKINQTIVIKMERDKKIDFCPGAAFFFGQIITEADEAGLEELRGYVRDFLAGCDIPPLITSDFENGCGSMVKGLMPLPYMMGLGAAGDPQLAYDYGKVTALEARVIGANWTFSPVCDLNINRRNPLVNNRAMTDDEKLACKMLPQVISGMQENGLVACAKHFPGDGVDYRDQHITTTENSLTMEEWYRTFGALYKELIEAGVQTIMAGHIALPDYPQKMDERFGLPLPATLNRDLITGLLKQKLGFDGVVVTDALNMGGFHGWFDTHEQAEIEAFKAGCDMLLWPSEHYADNLERALLSGEVPMERLDDAVERILRVKCNAGLFDGDYQRFCELTKNDQRFIAEVQQTCAEKSITLVRDRAGHFPLSPEKTKKIGVVVVTEHEPAKAEALALKEELEQRGFLVDYFDENKLPAARRRELYENNDLVLYALFSRPFRPIGFLDYTRDQAWTLAGAFTQDHAADKNVFVSFGSPYFGDQYLARAQTYINAYSMLDCTVRGFVRAACGEIPFAGVSPVKLKN